MMMTMTNLPSSMTTLLSPLLTIHNLSVGFHQDGEDFVAVKEISLKVPKGKTVALVGESGSGKSVTALSILKLLPYPLAFHPSGHIFFKGQDLLQLSEEELCKVRGNQISMIFQEPMTSLNPLHTVEKQIGEVLMLHKGLSLEDARPSIIQLLERVGFNDSAQRLGSYPHQLSGGQRQRVMIAMALATEPDLLIADEPTTALDVTTQAQILSLLKALQQESGMALLLITHDLGLVRKMADDVAIMHQGEIVEQGPLDQIFTQPQHPYTRKLLHSEPRGRAVALTPQNPIVLSTRGLTVQFPIRRGLFRRQVGALCAVQDVNLHIRAGETVGIVGESGSGKTTLAMALLRLQAAEGEIVFLGQHIEKYHRRALRPLRRQMQVIFQDPFSSLSPRMTIADIIAEGVNVHKGVNIHKRVQDKKALEELVIEVMQQVGLDPATRHRYPHEFSGGQRQRIAIARAVILKPQFVILDEPTSALDRAVQNEILDLLKSLQLRYQMAYLFISHDLKIIRAISHRVMVMYQGRIVEANDTEQIFKNPQHPYTKTLILSAFYHTSSGTEHGI
jgi:microcin C transport system ATP-binding protein